MANSRVSRNRTANGRLQESERRNVLIVNDNDGHTTVYDADKPTVWVGLVFEMLKLSKITNDEAANAMRLIADGKCREVAHMLSELDAWSLNVRGGQYLLEEIVDEWVEGVAPFTEE